jgi:hypothetical protein
MRAEALSAAEAFWCVAAAIEIFGGVATAEEMESARVRWLTGVSAKAFAGKHTIKVLREIVMRDARVGCSICLHRAA